MRDTLRGLPYWGSKNARRSDGLGQWIAERLPRSKCYVEPFAGMLGVLLIREQTPVEVVNDLDERIVNWWRVVRDQPDELSAALMLTPVARAEYDYCKQAQWDTDIDPVERARCFTVIQCFSSVTTFKRIWKPGSHHSSYTSRLTDFSGRVLLLADRIRHVVIEQIDALELLELHMHRPDTLIYCDPPYKTSHHGNYSELPDWPVMEALLLNATAKVAVSGDPEDWPALSEAGWTLHTKRRLVAQPNYPVRQATEGLWCNFAASGQTTLL